jgi:hypothetical protein
MSTYRIPQRLKTIHYAMLRMELAGKSVREIAALTNYSLKHVYLIRQCPMYQAELRKMRERMQDTVVQNVAKAHATHIIASPHSAKRQRRDAHAIADVGDHSDEMA